MIEGRFNGARTEIPTGLLQRFRVTGTAPLADHLDQPQLTFNPVALELTQEGPENPILSTKQWSRIAQPGAFV